MEGALTFGHNGFVVGAMLQQYGCKLVMAAAQCHREWGVKMGNSGGIGGCAAGEQQACCLVIAATAGFFERATCRETVVEEEFDEIHHAGARGSFDEFCAIEIFAKLDAVRKQQACLADVVLLEGFAKPCFPATRWRVHMIDQLLEKSAVLLIVRELKDRGALAARADQQRIGANFQK